MKPAWWIHTTILVRGVIRQLLLISKSFTGPYLGQTGPDQTPDQQALLEPALYVRD